MNKKEFIEELKKLNIQVTEEQMALLNIYYKTLIQYNTHTNLTSILIEKDVYLKHFYDSLTITKIIDLNQINNLLDIGSGAGFPGVVLKIFFPHLNVFLIDSNNKKITFLKELTQKLNLEIIIIHERAENYIKAKINYFDMATARAVANLRILSEISLPFLKKGGYFIAMKGNAEQEIKEVKEILEFMNAEICQKIEFSLPLNGGKRSLIKIIKKSLSDIKNLRQYDQIIKNRLKKSKK